MPTNGNGSSISERARNTPRADAQMEIDEKQIDDANLEAALEERETLRVAKLEAQREFKDKDDNVRDRLAEFSLAVGEVARVGRFKIKKVQRQPVDVSFSTAPQPRLDIKADVE
jgi:hypothetical protein